MNIVTMGMNSFASILSATETAEASRVLGFDLQLIVQVSLHVITVIALFYILGRLLFNPVKDLLDKREADIANEYQNIANEKENAEYLKQEYEEKIRNIQHEAEKKLEEARRKALEQEHKILHEAREEADKIIARANLAIEREQEKAKDDMRVEIIEVATLMASKLIATSIDDEKRNTLFEETINEMGEETWLS